MDQQETHDMPERVRLRQRVKELEMQLDIQGSDSDHFRPCKQDILAILDASPEAIFLMEPDGTIIIANNALAKRLRLPLEAINGINAFANYSPELANKRREFAQQAIATGQPVTFVDQRDDLIFENTIYPVLNRKGEAVRLTVFSSDITCRAQAEKALQQSRSLLNETQKLTHAGGWEWDVAAQTMTWTDETYRIHGLSPSDILPGSAEHIRLSLNCYGPEDRPLVMAAFRCCAEQGRPYDLQFPFTAADGRRLWIRTVAWPVRDQERIIKVVGNIVDITDHKRVEESFRESEERFRTLADCAPVGIYLTDPDGDCTYVNRRWCETADLAPEEAHGKGWMNGLHPEDRATIGEKWYRSVQSGGNWGFEYRFRKRDGRIAWVYGTAAAQYAANGTVTGYVGTNIDITGRKQAEAEKAELAARNRQLQKAESLGRMAGAIAHHFNNQLQVVMGNLEMAMDDVPRVSGTLKTLNEAMDAARKAAEVSGRMLTYRGQASGQLEPLDLSEVCRQNLPLFQAAAPLGIVFETDFPASGPVIRANADQIRQILMHLVTNAREAAAGNPGTIGLTVKTVCRADIPAAKRFPVDWQPQEGDHACLEVADTACGIDCQDIERLFDPFFTTKFAGRGMGLSVVIGIVLAHGGGITVESEPGHGSVFRIFIPVLVAEVPGRPDFSAMPEARQTAEAVAGSKIQGGGTVLLIEDEAPVRRMAAIMLMRLGYQVLEAEDGVDGVAVFEQHQEEICCVLCDLTMPRMSGWDTLAALRKLSPDIPVILSSGYDEERVMAGEHPEHPDAFLGKPYQRKGLGETISRVLNAPVHKHQ